MVVPNSLLYEKNLVKTNFSTTFFDVLAVVFYKNLGIHDFYELFLVSFFIPIGNITLETKKNKSSKSRFFKIL